MRCAHVGPLVERFVDGSLGEHAVMQVTAHARACSRCTKRIEAARAVAHALITDASARAPKGFAAKVMEGVYRQALSAPREPLGAPLPADRTPARSPVAAARFYRKLGLSLVLTAGVLAVSMFIPRGAYPTLVGSGRTGISREGAVVVQSALLGAGSTVRGILGETVKEGSDR
jgi:hypothetical protein